MRINKNPVVNAAVNYACEIERRSPSFALKTDGKGKGGGEREGDLSPRETS